MAFWVVGGELPRARTEQLTVGVAPGKRREDYFGWDSHHEPQHSSKRARVDSWGTVLESHGSRYETKAHFVGDSVPVKNLAFLVIREREQSPPTPGRPSADDVADIERTESGLSITQPHSKNQADDEEHDAFMLNDEAAARIVQNHVQAYRRRCSDSQHERILKTLINPKSREADFPLDNDALRSIFSAANELFFANRLSQRVAWDWSHAKSSQYQSHIVGTTALRRSSRLPGYETLIVLSSPILKDTKYNRRLLISTFIHEMIHSFLFVTCGQKAGRDGGHTRGFRRIADIIDDWAGKEYLRLGDMEANLERFRGDAFSSEGTMPEWSLHEQLCTHDGGHLTTHYHHQHQRTEDNREWHCWERERFAAGETAFSDNSPGW